MLKENDLKYVFEENIVKGPTIYVSCSDPDPAAQLLYVRDSDPDPNFQSK